MCVCVCVHSGNDDMHFVSRSAYVLARCPLSKPEPIMLLNLPIILSRISTIILQKYPIILKIPDVLSPVTVLILKILACVYS